MSPHKPLVEVEVEERFYPRSIELIAGLPGAPPATWEVPEHHRFHITIPEATFTEEEQPMYPREEEPDIDYEEAALAKRDPEAELDRAEDREER